VLKKMYLDYQVLRRIEDLGKKRKVVAIFSSEEGCIECEILEYLLKREGLDRFIDFIVYIKPDDESVKLALENGIDVIPLVIIIYDKGKKIRLDDLDPEVLLKKLKEHIRDRVELYNNLKKYYLEHAKKLEAILGKPVEVDEDVIIEVVHRVEAFGKPYCPCRVERDEKTICPCFYHVDELKHYGRCRCGLFRIKK